MSEGCTNCTCEITFPNTTHVPGFGPRTAQIAFVGEAPGREENTQGKPFVGGAGRMFTALCIKGGLDRYQEYTTNVVKHQPPGNDISLCNPGLQHEALLDELDKLPNLKVIVPLGNHALHAFGQHGITNWRGSVFNFQLPSRRTCQVIPTFHPSFILRGKQEMFPVVIEDIRKIRNYAYGMVEHHVKEYLTKPTLREATAFIDDLINEPPRYITLDVEGYADALEMVGIGTKHRAVCIPFEEEFIPLLLKAIHHLHFTMQNGNYDKHVIENSLGVLPKMWFDTLLGHHLICSGHPHGLYFLTSLYSDLPYYKDQSNVDRERYNCMDVDGTSQVAEEEVKWLHKYDMQELFDTVMKASHIVYRMARRGITYHLPTCKKIAEEYATRCAVLEKQMQDLAKMQYFNPDSPRDVATALYEVLGLPKIYKRGTNTVTTSEVLLRKKYPNVDFVKWILEYRHKAKMVRTYIPQLEDERVEQLDEDHIVYHPDWKLHGTETGRYSCHIHTYPPEMRKVIVARPNYKLLVIDYSQIEFRILMHDSQDPVGLRLMAEGGDIHRKCASVVFKKSEVDVTKGERHLCKFITHGSNYGRGPQGIAEQFNMELWEAVEMQEQVMGPFTAARTWQQACIDRDIARGYSQNAFNRRRYWFNAATKRPDTEREIKNFYPQSEAHDILMRASIKVSEYIDLHKLDVHIIADHHDALIFEVHNTLLSTIVAPIQEIMEQSYLTNLVIPTEAKFGECWGELQD